MLLHDTFVDDDPDRQSSSFDFILVFNPWDIFTLGIIIIIITCLAFNPRDLYATEGTLKNEIIIIIIWCYVCSDISSGSKKVKFSIYDRHKSSHGKQVELPVAFSYISLIFVDYLILNTSHDDYNAEPERFALIRC